ncbi:MAG: alpha-amylase [Duncaniella sp.]|nr:alpha-amylase [Duncaniella sp.]
MNKAFLLLSTLALAAVSCKPGGDSEAKTDTQDDVILHAWSWEFDTIAANMKDIAEAGYAYVQTSPANTCFVGEEGGKALFSQPGDSVKGKWYYYYQPTDWKIGNYLLGTRDQFKNMMDSAAKYNVKVIVDVLPNHTAVDHTAVLPDLDAAVGGHKNLFHANGFNDIRDYNDRYECTTGMMGGLPDVNTENPDFQKYYLAYVNDLLSLGVKGFRYDTAKHIGLPSDPLDSLATANNFWPVVLGQEEVDGVRLAAPRDSLFIYGEVLQDKNVKEKEYAELMQVTASGYGHALRHSLAGHKWNEADSLQNWHHSAPGSRLVTWVESHDTYANEHESAGLTDEQIRMGGVILASRQNGTPLFFSRPAGSTRENYWGNNLTGARGNDEFKHPEVVAVNKFRRAMSGQPESIATSLDGAVVEINRGNRGVAVINLSQEEMPLEMPTTISDGNYGDKVYNQEFTVQDGIIRGTLKPMTSYVIYK